jgi:hypothetical protein
LLQTAQTVNGLIHQPRCCATNYLARRRATRLMPTRPRPIRA